MINFIDSGILEVISIVTPLILAVVWFVRLEARSKSNYDDVRSLQTRIHALEKSGLDMADRMARIETKLDIILDSISKKNLAS